MESFPMEKNIDGDDEKTLKGLSEAFSSLSLEEIATAYYKAGQDANLAGQIPYVLQEKTGWARNTQASKLSPSDVSEKPCPANGKYRAPKKKWRPVSGGSVSGILGKDYVKSVPAANGACMGTKPVKLDSSEFPASELWGEEPKRNLSNNGHMQKDVEDFLFKMLGDGFQLDRDVIHQVLDKCGYDAQKSMEKLLDMSAVNSDDGNKCPDETTKELIVGESSYSEMPACQTRSLPISSKVGRANGTPSKTMRGSQKEDEINDHPKEILVALFNNTNNNDKEEALSRRAARLANRSRAYGQLVVEPPKHFTPERKPNVVEIKQEHDNGDDEEEDSYQKLRKAVKEHRVTMKEYYRAAVEAFSRGDYKRAYKLIDEGHFYHEKAQKADEESSKKIFETKHVDTQEELTLNLHEHDAKESRRLLKLHLNSFSGIPSIKYLKVIIDTTAVDTTKGQRRRWVMNLLENESIKWNEGENAGTIVIRMDNVNRKALSFNKK